MKTVRFRYDESYFEKSPVCPYRVRTLTGIWMTCEWENAIRSLYVTYDGDYDHGFYLNEGWYPFASSDNEVYATWDDAYNAFKKAIPDWLKKVEQVIQDDKNIPDEEAVEVVVYVNDVCRELLRTEPLKRFCPSAFSLKEFDNFLQSFPHIYEEPLTFVRYGREVVNDSLYCKIMEHVCFPNLPLYEVYGEEILYSILDVDHRPFSEKAEVYRRAGLCNTESELWKMLKEGIGNKKNLLDLYLDTDKEKAKKFLDYAF